MKKTALCLTLLLLLASLFACGRREALREQMESEKAAESIADASEKDSQIIGISPRPQETVAPDTSGNGPLEQLPNADGYRLTAGLKLGNSGCYDGLTVDELKERFEAEGMLDMSNQIYNTPTGMILNMEDTHMPAYYHKLTGNISTLCPDPLCRHEDCVWVQLREILYISDEHIYFRSGDIVQAQVFRSDLERNHVEALDLVLPLGSRICFVENEKIYLQQNVYQENNAGVSCYGVFDCMEKTFTQLSGAENVEVLAVTGETLWYWSGRDADIYKTDVRFSKPGEKFAPLAGFDGIEDHQGDYLLLKKNGELDSLYNVQTGELTSVRGRIGSYSHGPIFVGQYVYYCKRVTESEIEVSPWKAYFTYELPRPGRPDLTIPSKGKDAGRIYRLNLETGEEELVMELLYNGVPIWTYEFAVDGHAMYVAYLTYEDHNNYYNQDYMADNPDAILHTEPVRYLCMDMQNGTITLLDPYKIEWS